MDTRVSIISIIKRVACKMTNRALKKRLIIVAIAVLAILTISFFEYLYTPPSSRTYVSSNATLFALLFAAYLAYLFQQRGKFVDDLRKWWNEIVQAKSEFFAYCDKGKPTEDDYLKSFYRLSTAMDTLRLIYCNVDRSPDNPKGYYPFEQVRDIVDVARSVRWRQELTEIDRAKAKMAINLIFQSLRHAIQAEASASVPDEPTLYESKYRQKYLGEILQGVGVDVMKIRAKNKKEDYVARRERT